MSTSAANVGRRLGLHLRRHRWPAAEVTQKQLCREIDAAFARWRARQPEQALKRLAKPEQMI